VFEELNRVINARGEFKTPSGPTGPTHIHSAQRRETVRENLTYVGNRVKGNLRFVGSGGGGGHGWPVGFGRADLSDRELGRSDLPSTPTTTTPQQTHTRRVRTRLHTPSHSRLKLHTPTGNQGGADPHPATRMILAALGGCRGLNILWRVSKVA
jgi:hypothetical protein